MDEAHTPRQRTYFSPRERAIARSDLERSMAYYAVVHGIVPPGAVVDATIESVDEVGQRSSRLLRWPFRNRSLA